MLQKSRDIQNELFCSIRDIPAVNENIVQGELVTCSRVIHTRLKSAIYSRAQQALGREASSYASLRLKPFKYELYLPVTGVEPEGLF